MPTFQTLAGSATNPHSYVTYYFFKCVHLSLLLSHFPLVPKNNFVIWMFQQLFFLLLSRDCMKGDETENKKIGCTVNLMVRTLCILFLVYYSLQILYSRNAEEELVQLMFPKVRKVKCLMTSIFCLKLLISGSYS